LGRGRRRRRLRGRNAFAVRVRDGAGEKRRGSGRERDEQLRSHHFTGTGPALPFATGAILAGSARSFDDFSGRLCWMMTSGVLRRASVSFALSPATASSCDCSSVRLTTVSVPSLPMPVQAPLG